MKYIANLSGSDERYTITASSPLAAAAALREQLAIPADDWILVRESDGTVTQFQARATLKPARTQTTIADPPAPPVETPTITSHQPPLMTDDELHQAVVSLDGRARTNNSLPVLFLTLILFVAVGGLRWGWTGVVYIAVAIAFHELGARHRHAFFRV